MQENFLKGAWGQMAAAPVEKRKDRQEEAVEHGVGLQDGKIAGPLLIIAGADSGKTNPWRTARAPDRQWRRSAPDPADDVLRRAASGMARRAPRICKQCSVTMPPS